MRPIMTMQKWCSIAKLRALAVIVGLSLLVMGLTACGTVTGTAVGAGSGAAIGAAAGDPGRGHSSALVSAPQAVLSTTLHGECTRLMSRGCPSALSSSDHLTDFDVELRRIRQISVVACQLHYQKAAAVTGFYSEGDYLPPRDDCSTRL